MQGLYTMMKAAKSKGQWKTAGPLQFTEKLGLSSPTKQMDHTQNAKDRLITLLQERIGAYLVMQV